MPRIVIVPRRQSNPIFVMFRDFHHGLLGGSFGPPPGTAPETTCAVVGQASAMLRVKYLQGVSGGSPFPRPSMPFTHRKRLAHQDRGLRRPECPRGRGIHSCQCRNSLIRGQLFTFANCQSRCRPQRPRSRQFGTPGAQSPDNQGVRTAWASFPVEPVPISSSLSITLLTRGKSTLVETGDGSPGGGSPLA